MKRFDTSSRLLYLRITIYLFKLQRPSYERTNHHILRTFWRTKIYNSNSGKIEQKVIRCFLCCLSIHFLNLYNSEASTANRSVSLLFYHVKTVTRPRKDKRLASAQAWIYEWPSSINKSKGVWNLTRPLLPTALLLNKPITTVSEFCDAGSYGSPP
jgi:hypothetical protein